MKTTKKILLFTSACIALFSFNHSKKAQKGLSESVLRNIEAFAADDPETPQKTGVNEIVATIEKITTRETLNGKEYDVVYLKTTYKDCLGEGDLACSVGLIIKDYISATEV